MIADQTPVILLVLIAVGVVFGGGVIVLSRRRSRSGEPEFPAGSSATSHSLNVATSQPEPPAETLDVAAT
jgi:hypothetical protein